MRKNFILLLTIFVLGTVLFAGGTQETPLAEKESSEATKQTLRITGQSWHVEKIFLQQAADAFMKDHPNVTVEVSTYAEPNVISNYAIDWSRGKTPVDIAVVSGAQYASQFVPKDLIYDFDGELNFFTGNFTKDKFVGTGLENGKVGDKQFVMPLIIEVYALVINKQMFEEAGLVDSDGNPLTPLTWEEFYQFAKKLHKVEKGVVVQQGASLQWSVMNTQATLLAVLRAARGSEFGPDGLTVDFDNPEFRQILKIWKRGADEGVFSKEMYGDHFAGRNSLLAGKLAMLLDSGGRFVEGARTLGEENVTVIPFPGAANNGSYGFGSGVIIPKASKVPELAVQFIKEQLLGEFVQTSAVNQHGKMPAILAHYSGATSPEWQTLKQIANNSGAPPTYRDFAKFMKGTPIILQDYLDGRMTLDQAVKDFKNLAESLDTSTM